MTRVTRSVPQRRLITGEGVTLQIPMAAFYCEGFLILLAT
jgi:hypothetical protein